MTRRERPLPASPLPRQLAQGDARLQHATQALNARRPLEAERIARDLLEADPRDGRAAQILGYALLMQDRAQVAIAPLETAARSSHDPEVETRLAIALSRVGRRDDALSHLKRAIKRRPPFAPAYYELGGLYIAVRRLDEAVEVLSRGVELAPMAPEFSIRLGYVLLQRRDCGGAKSAFGRALAISPQSFEALCGMGKAHQEFGESKPAADYFRRCLAIRPDVADLWLNLGHCLLELGDRDGGFECFRAAARGGDTRYCNALSSLVKSSRGRFWIRPSAAQRSLLGDKRSSAHPREGGDPVVFRPA